MSELKQIDVSKVMSVYSGKPGCCCGCRGKHTYAKVYQEQAGTKRGYAVMDDEVNDRVVRRHVKLLNDNIDQVQFDDAGDHAYLELETASGNERLYIAYFA